jgi:anti-sigma28 factor (negative regulator of flagellin synthesis)
MKDTDIKTTESYGEDVQPAEKPVRRRRVTTINLKWIAEKVRKAKNIQEQIQTGDYKVDPFQTAKALLNCGQKE